MLLLLQLYNKFVTGGFTLLPGACCLLPRHPTTQLPSASFADALEPFEGPLAFNFTWHPTTRAALKPHICHSWHPVPTEHHKIRNNWFLFGIFYRLFGLCVLFAFGILLRCFCAPFCACVWFLVASSALCLLFSFHTLLAFFVIQQLTTSTYTHTCGSWWKSARKTTFPYSWFLRFRFGDFFVGFGSSDKFLCSFIFRRYKHSSVNQKKS